MLRCFYFILSECCVYWLLVFACARLDARAFTVTTSETTTVTCTIEQRTAQQRHSIACVQCECICVYAHRATNLTIIPPLSYMHQRACAQHSTIL